MMKLLINTIAIASRKGGRINKHSVIGGLVHMLSPLTNILILLILSVFNSKVSTTFFLTVSIVFHGAVMLLMNWKFSFIEKQVNKERLRSISPKRHEMFAVIYLILVLVVGFISMFAAMYVSEIAECFKKYSLF